MAYGDDPMRVGEAEDLLPNAAEESRAAAEQARKETEEIEQAALDRMRKEATRHDEEAGLFDDDAQSGIDSLFGKKEK